MRRYRRPLTEKQRERAMDWLRKFWVCFRNNRCTLTEIAWLCSKDCKFRVSTYTLRTLTGYFGRQALGEIGDEAFRRGRPERLAKDSDYRKPRPVRD